MLKFKNIILFTLLFLVIGIDVKAQDSCIVKEIEGEFAYEESSSLWSEDDMIFRKAVFFNAENKNILIENGFFVFETFDKIPQKFITSENENDIKYFTNSLNDSLHSYLKNLNTKTIQKKEGNYKHFKFKLEVISLGNKEIMIKRRNKFVNKMIPCYLVVKFIEISTMD